MGFLFALLAPGMIEALAGFGSALTSFIAGIVALFGGGTGV